MKAKVGIYIPLGQDGFELCQPVSARDFERINVEINGTPRQSDWKPVPVNLVHTDQGRTLIESDSPWLGSHALIFKAKAFDLMGPALGGYGEILPLTCSEAKLWIYNTMHVIDALDESASSVLRFNDGRIMMIQRHVFRAELVGENYVFKIPNLRVSPTFVSQRFVDQWNEAGLNGLEFKQVWASPNS
jgi:hypothetical protein